MLGDQPGLHNCSGVVYGCRAAATDMHSPSPPCVSHRPGAGLIPGEWALAQTCCPTSVPGPAERVRGGSLCLEPSQTFALGKGPFSIFAFVGPQLDQASQNAPPPPLQASGPHPRSSQGSPQCLREPGVYARGAWGHGWSRALASFSCNQPEVGPSSPLWGQQWGAKGRRRSIHPPALVPGLGACRKGLVMPTCPPGLLAQRV